MKKIFASIFIISLCILCFYGAYKIDSPSKASPLKKTLTQADFNLYNNDHQKIKEMSEGYEDKEVKEVKESKPKEVTTEDPNKKQNEVKVPEKTSVPEPKKEEPPPQPVKNPLIDDDPNIIIKDYVSGNVILAKRVNFAGKTVADITLELLDKYNISRRYSLGYFSMIAGLKEKDAGDNSGWIYYVDGKVAHIGAKDYPLNGNEKIEWKYLKDALNVEK